MSTQMSDLFEGQNNHDYKAHVLQMVVNQTKMKQMSAEEIVEYTRTLLLNFQSLFDIAGVAIETTPTPDSLAVVEEAPIEYKLVCDPATAIADEQIICCLCGKPYKSLTVLHLKHHNITKEKYREICDYQPKEPLMAYEERKRKSQNLKETALPVRRRNARIAKDREAALAQGFDPDELSSTE